MPDEPTETVEDQYPELTADHPALKALRSEREARKALETQVKNVQREADTFVELKTKYPFLDRDFLKGHEVEQWETVAQKLANLVSSGTPVEKPASEPEPEKPEVEELAKAQGLSGTTGGTGETFTPAQVQQIGLKDQAAALRIIAENRMQMPGL